MSESHSLDRPIRSTECDLNEIYVSFRYMSKHQIEMIWVSQQQTYGLVGPTRNTVWVHEIMPISP